MKKKNILDCTLTELQNFISEQQQPAYRAKQIFVGLYQKKVNCLKQINNIPQSLLSILEKHYGLDQPELLQLLNSTDGTEKYLFKLTDGNFIETVLIPAPGRNTICLSTQVGCKFHCPFCASGSQGFRRNLEPGEIINQILYIQRHSNRQITNYVFMGMGEPLDNYENILAVLAKMTGKQTLGISARRITVSTCGLIPAIKKLAGLKLQLNLSLSLHAANDKLRNRLVPINKKYPLIPLIDACRQYTKKTGRMMTLEYILLNKINDHPEDARALAKIAKKLQAKINIIPYSDNLVTGYHAPSPERTQAFISALKSRGRTCPGPLVSVTLRESKGRDIRAACGQLALRT